VSTPRGRGPPGALVLTEYAIAAGAACAGGVNWGTAGHVGASSRVNSVHVMLRAYRKAQQEQDRQPLMACVAAP
jgi:hypothetical protein